MISDKNNGPSEINALKQLSDYYTDANTDSALYYAGLLETAATKAGDESARAYALSDIGLSFQNKGNSIRALSLNLKALQILKGIKDSANIADTYLALAQIYNAQKNETLVLQYDRKSWLLATKIKDYKDMYLSALSLGALFLYSNQLDSALYYNSQALYIEKHKRINYPVIYIETLESLSDVYIKLKQYDRAGALLRQAIDNGEKRDKPHLYSAQLAYAYFLLTTHQTDSSLYYANLVFDHLHKHSELTIANSLYPLLAQIYEEKKQFDLAYKYQEESIKAKDSLLNAGEVQQIANLTFNEQQHETDLKNSAVLYRSNLKLYSLIIVLILAIIILAILWKANEKQQNTNKQLREQQDELKAAQNQLVQSAKMASLGELTAGIAHEIQNPLNFVNNFSEVNAELIDDMQLEIERGNLKEIVDIAFNIKQNEQKINMHGNRAGAIVKGMLQHSQNHSGTKEPVDINALADEYLHLSYNSFIAKEKSFFAEMITHYDVGLPVIRVVPQDIGRVLLNLFNNAFYAVNEKKKKTGEDYKPEITVTTFYEKGSALINVKDNGTGISDANKDRIMQPFFTTKPTGEGTGLGLSLSYDMIVKGHNGTINVITQEGAGSEFIIQLPV